MKLQLVVYSIVGLYIYPDNNKLDTQKFLLHKMPSAFINTGHGITDLILDATEFKFQSASNFDLSSLIFSHYKNTTIGKALIGISPHGMESSIKYVHSNVTLF